MSALISQGRDALCRFGECKETSGHAPCILDGERGTGKTRLANVLHSFGHRSKGPWVEVDCAAIPETLWETHLFGHVRGAFNEAGQARDGFVAAAEGGTIFFDEIGEVPLSCQAKLLKFIEERTYRRVGPDAPLERADVRIVAATNRDLAALAKQGRFREDLRDRLSLDLRIPPLADRREDIGPLAKWLLQRHRAEYGRPNAVWGEGCLALLAQQAWPGNIRQLKNAIQSALVLAENDVLEASLLRRVLEKAPAQASAQEIPGIWERVFGGERMSLPEIANEFGEPAALAVGRSAIDHFKGLPPEEDCRKLFGMKYRAFQQWLYQRGVTRSSVLGKPAPEFAPGPRA